MIDTTYTGTVNECIAHFYSVCHSYHPAGYGTRISRVVENADGTVTITVTRAVSCD